MRKSPLALLLAAALALLAFPSGCTVTRDSTSKTVSSSDFRVTTNLTARGQIPEDVTHVEIENLHGSVRVVGVSAGQTGWEWELELRTLTEALAEEIAAAANCSSMREGSRLRVVVSMPDQRQRYNFRSDLSLRVPKAVSVTCRNRYGEVEVSEISGSADVVNQHGAVKLRDLPGMVKAETSYAALTARRTGPATLTDRHGAMTIEHVDGALVAETSYAALTVADVRGHANLRNQHGSVNLTRVSGRADVHTSYAALVAREVSGDVVLVNQHGSIEAGRVNGSVQARTSYAALEVEAAGERLACQNQHGAVRVRALSPSLGSLSASTSYALLEVRLPAALQPAVRARTSHGEIDSDFPVILKPRDDDAFLQAAANSPRVSLENQHGNIRVIRQ